MVAVESIRFRVPSNAKFIRSCVVVDQKGRASMGATFGWKISDGFTSMNRERALTTKQKTGFVPESRGIS